MPVQVEFQTILPLETLASFDAAKQAVFTDAVAQEAGGEGGAGGVGLLSVLCVFECIVLVGAVLLAVKATWLPLSAPSS